MSTHFPSTSQDDFEKICTICGRPAFTRYYGAISCQPCKMFFRRAIIEKLVYKCKKIQKCYVTSSGSPLKCPSCRFKRCVEVGMKLPPTNYSPLELQNQKDDEISGLMKKLEIMDKRRSLKYLSFYSNENPCLDEVLKGKPITSRIISPDMPSVEWSLLAIYNVIDYFRKFDFIEQLDLKDKKILFQMNTFKANLLCGAWRSRLEYRDKILTPFGQQIFPDVLVTKFNTSADLLNRVCCQVVARLNELKMTEQEFVLLSVIFFCNTSNSHSPSAISILSTQQNIYASALFRYCQLTYQHAAPSRLNDLLSIYHIIQKNTSEMQYIGIMIQGFIPNFPIRRLVADTYMLGKSK